MKKYFLGTFLLLLLILTTGCKKSLVGKWKSINAQNEYYYIFNEDNTCSYEMTVARLSCVYEEENGILTILYNGNDTAKNFEYRFEGNTLIIKDDNGKDNKFTRQNK